MKIYCATTNPGKLREFEAEPMPNLASIEPPEETGATFEENAAQKAIYYSTFSDDFVFVDDSGLAVDALNGAPCVYSARFAGPGATDDLDQGHRTQAWLAVSDDPAARVTGQYFYHMRPRAPDPQTHDVALQDRLIEQAPLGRTLERRGLRLLDDGLPALPDQLVDGRTTNS